VIQTERHTAVVSDNIDPETRGRIQVRSLSLLGSDDVVLHIWIEPCFDWGWFYVPDKGEQVEIEVVSGSDKDGIPGQAFLEAPDFRWRGKRFYDPERDPRLGGPKTPINNMFTSSNYGKRRGFATPAGHVLMFDDTPGQESVVLSWKNALGQLQRIELKDGVVLLGENATDFVALAAKVHSEISNMLQAGVAIGGPGAANFTGAKTAWDLIYVPPLTGVAADKVKAE